MSKGPKIYTEVIQVAITPEQKDKLLKNSKKDCLSLSAHIRRIILSELAESRTDTKIKTKNN
jgi:hypothetical protein